MLSNFLEWMLVQMPQGYNVLKFRYSEKATKMWSILSELYEKIFVHENTKKITQKKQNSQQNFCHFRHFSLTAKQPKMKILCSQMCFIQLLHIHRTGTSSTFIAMDCCTHWISGQNFSHSTPDNVLSKEVKKLKEQVCSYSAL